MADFKVVLNFASTGIKGGIWSETWYRQAGSLQLAATFATNWLTARLALLHPLNLLTKIRVSQVGNSRATTVVSIRRYGEATNAFPPAPIDSAVVCTVSSLLVPATRRWWWRGWPSGFAERDGATGNDVFAPIVFTQLFQWWQALAQYQFEVLPQQKATVAGTMNYNVVSVDGSVTAGQSVVTTDKPNAIVAGNQVIMHRFSKKDLPGLNGVWTVLSSAGGASFNIGYVTPNAAKVIQGGQARNQVLLTGAFIDPVSSGPAFIGSRQTKSPFSGSRGARSANRRLRTSL